MIFVKVIVVLFVCFIIFSIIFMRLKVVGNSMLPTLSNGDILLSIRYIFAKRVKEGDIVVCRVSEKLVIKRVYKVAELPENSGAFYIYLLGDNPAESYDSRNYGYVREACIVAKVLWLIKKL